MASPPKRLPTALVLGAASVMISIGVVALYASQSDARPTAGRSRTEVRIDRSTPERAAESFLDAWRKRRFGAALEVAHGDARNAVLARMAEEKVLSRDTRELQEVWEQLAAARLELRISESETLPDGRLVLRGEVEGEFLQSPYRRRMEFVLLRDGDDWLVDLMTPGEILTKLPEQLEIER